jgi:magnesium-protoporphyrin IX monomethyl ester (oxidative) cyclase
VLLIEPPINPITARFGLPAVANYPPLAQVRLAGQLEGDVRIVDLRLPGEQRRLEALLRAEPPSVVGISLTFTSNGDEAIRVAADVRRASPGAVIVLGGTAASEDRNAFFESAADFLCIRQGDAAFRELVRAVREDRYMPEAPTGFHRRDGAGWIAGPPAPHVPLDSLRPYAWDRVPRRAWRSYFQGFRATGMSQTSEGCPYDCNFCSVWKTHGRKVDVAALANVKHDFDSLPPSVRAFFFADDIWMQALEPQKRQLYDPLLEWMTSDFLRRRPEVWLTVETRTDLFLREKERFAAWIRRGNLKRILFGIEAVTDAQLDAFSKRNTVQKNSDAIRQAAELGAFVTAQIVIPCDADREYFDEIVRFLDAHRPWVKTANFTIATPLPGTDLYAEMLRDDPDLADRRVITHPAFSLFTALSPTRLEPAEFYAQVARVYRAANHVSFTWSGVTNIWQLTLKNPWLLRQVLAMPLVLRGLVDPRTYLEVDRAVQRQRPWRQPKAVQSPGAARVDALLSAR